MHSRVWETEELRRTSLPLDEGPQFQCVVFGCFGGVQGVRVPCGFGWSSSSSPFENA